MHNFLELLSSISSTSVKKNELLMKGRVPKTLLTEEFCFMYQRKVAPLIYTVLMILSQYVKLTLHEHFAL